MVSVHILSISRSISISRVVSSFFFSSPSVVIFFNVELSLSYCSGVMAHQTMTSDMFQQIGKVEQEEALQHETKQLAVNNQKVFL